MPSRVQSIPVLLGLAALSGACGADSEPHEYVSGSVSIEYTFRDLLDACTRDHGTKFVFLDDVERDFPRLNFTETSCFVLEGTKRSDIQLIADIQDVQASVLGARDRAGLDLMIDREPLPGTRTYRIYRLPRDAPNPWKSDANAR